MLIKKIISLCKESKTLISMITQSGKLMWISNGYAAYPAYSVPVMDPEEILQMHDIPEDKSLSYCLREESLPFSPDMPHESADAYVLEAMPIQIEVLGVRYKPFIRSLTNHVYYIDVACFAPFADSKEEKQYFLKRNIVNGNPLVMVFAGLTPLAAISPAELNWEQVYKSCAILTADASNKLCTVKPQQEDDTLQQMSMDAEINASEAAAAEKEE